MKDNTIMEKKVVFKHDECERVGTLMWTDDGFYSLRCCGDFYRVPAQDVREMTDDEEAREIYNGFFVYTSDDIFSRSSTSVYHDFQCECGEDPCVCLIHVEIDPNGVTHVRPYERDMEYALYHPEWREYQMEIQSRSGSDMTATYKAFRFPLGYDPGPRPVERRHVIQQMPPKPVRLRK